MSWSVRIIAPATTEEFGYVKPWRLYAGEDGTRAELLLHAGALDVYLDSEDSAAPIYRAGYLPTTNPVERVMSVDAASGGDWDQVRATTIYIADQMDDETSMSAFLEAHQVRLKGATIELVDGIPVEGEPMPAPYWTGRIVMALPEDLSIKLSCESDGDTDPLGKIVDASIIQPIVFGHVRNMELAVLQDEITYPALARQGYADWGARPAKSDTTHPNRHHAFDAEMPFLPSARIDPETGSVLSLRHQVGEFMYLDATSRLLFLFLNAKSIGDDLFLQYFPDGVVPDSNWQFEVMSGSGKGARISIEKGASVSIWRGTGTTPHFTSLPAYDAFGNPTPYNTGYLVTRLAKFFASYDSWAILVDYTLQADPRLSGTYTDDLDEQISYLRLLHYDKRIVKPQLVSSLTHKFLIDGTYGNYQSFGVIDEGDRYLVDLRRHPDASAHLFQRMEIRGDFDVSTQHYPPTLTGSVAELFDLEGGEVTVSGDFRTLVLGITHVRSSGETLADVLKGIKRMWLSISATYSEYLAVTLRVKGRQAQTAFSRLSIDGEWRIETMPIVLAETRKVFAAENGGINLVFDWEPGFSPDAPIGTLGGLALAPPGELDVVQYIELVIEQLATPADESEWWYDRGECTDDLVINRIAIHLERETSLDQFWGDAKGPTYLQCPGGIERIIDDVPINSFAIERNLNVPLSAGIAPDQPIEDHVHTIEGLLRSTGHYSAHIDEVSFEQAYVDMMSKTQLPNETTGLMEPEAVALRPKCSLVLTDVTQAGDVYAQLCRDAGLIGGRDSQNRRTLKAFLARTWLEEQDAELHDYYEDGTPGDFLRGSVELGLTSIDDVVTSPLIRYAMEAGDPTRYIQVLHPEASAYNAAYCLGFENPDDAQRAWEICHEGWLRTGVIHAREMTMDTVYEHSSLIKLLMPPRGCGQLEWMSRQKTTLTYTISDSSPAAKLPNGSRLLLEQWLHAPGGKWGTLVKTTARRSAGEAQQVVILDPAP